jgi:mono/diheme cytochrome c family protein
MTKSFLKYLLLPITVMLFMTSCNHDRNHPGYAYMPDMYYSEPYDVYTENPLFRDSLTMQTPVKGTIARGQEPPYPYLPKSADDQKRAGLELVNTIPSSPEVLADGKEQYTIYCMNCHGIKGDGKGYLYTSKRFTAMPTSLLGDRVKNMPDGEIYHVITLGSLSGLMGPHGSQVMPENRWKIIHYVRELGK